MSYKLGKIVGIIVIILMLINLCLGDVVGLNSSTKYHLRTCRYGKTFDLSWIDGCEAEKFNKVACLVCKPSCKPIILVHPYMSIIINPKEPTWSFIDSKPAALVFEPNTVTVWIYDANEWKLYGVFAQ